MRMANEQNSMYHSINLDILGLVKFKLARLTRATRITKLWILQATCQLSSAVCFTVMESYSTESFLSALETHARRTRYPVNITTDAGSQLKAGIKRMTRSQSASSDGVDDVSDETAAAALEDRVKAAKHSLKQSAYQWNFGGKYGCWK